MGYEVKLVFIGLNAPILNISRVAERVQQGGHFVAPEDIIRRYERSMNNLIKALDLANKVYIFDNSGTRTKIVCRIKNKEIIRQSNDLPKWIKNSGIATKLNTFDKPKIKSILQEENKKSNYNMHPSPYKDPFKKTF